jgi:hypothetical protein
MKCVHCLKILEQETKDHVFPKSWYPDNTPNEVQRWTVPSCAQCNGRLGRAEKEMFVRLALCANPTKAQAAGMSKKALRTLGIGVAEIEPKEKAHRIALLRKVFAEAKQLKDAGDRVLLPGVGPHPGFPAGEQLVITIPDDALRIVSEKIVRGCEYKLNSSAYVEEPLRVKIYFVHDKGAEDLTAFLEKLPVSSLGPGFEIRRGQSGAQEGVHVVLYRITIWGTLKIYGAIDEEAV